MKLVWTRVALGNRRAIREFIATDNPLAALAMDSLLTKKASQLADHPQIGRPGAVPGTRELVVHPNYILVYDITGDALRILRVLHAARQWPPGC